MTDLADLKIKIFADGADLKQIEALAANPLVKGFTTNPSLLRKAGVTDYADFAKEAIRIVGDRPISFEVFADDLAGMERQARIIAGWGENVYVKIPITNTKGEFVGPLLRRLSTDKIKVNVTAIMTSNQLAMAQNNLWEDVPHYLSIFAGRITDTGIQINELGIFSVIRFDTCELIWASPREVINIWQAQDVGADIITVGPDILAKLSGVGKNLDTFSLETVQMFFNDALAAGYNIEEGVNAVG